MPGPLHRNQLPTDGIHVFHAFEFADAAARLAYVAVVADEGKAARQLSDQTFWILQTAPATWMQITPTGAFVPDTRQVISGAGLTGGGDLTADRTLAVGANADGSITVNADDIQVGILATDAQHGVRGGGTQHAVAIPAGAAGFMSGADKSKLDGVAVGATATPLSVVAPVDVDRTAAAVGVGVSAARADHKHDISTAVAGTIQPDDAAAEGTATSVARSDHKHAIVADLAGSILIGDAAAEGASTSFSRADHKHGLAVPAAPVDVTKAASSAGASTAPARADHKHDISTAAAVALTSPGANAEGTATSLARSDHTHALPEFPTTLVWGSGSVSATTTTRYLQPGFDTGTAPTSAVQIRVPQAGTIKNLFIRQNTTAGNGNAIVYTLRKNGAAQTLTVSIASTTQNGSDVTHSFAVAQGDTLDIEVTKAASVGTSPSDITATVEFAP